MGFRRKNQERRVECDFGEEQQGFRKGRGTADGMYVQRQMVENTLEVYGSMAPGFVDLGKAFDTVPREKVMATLRWMGVPEPEVMMGNETSVYHNQLVECRTRNRESPGSNPRCYRLEVWEFSFTSRRLSRLSCINEYLAIDSGGNVSE